MEEVKEQKPTFSIKYLDENGVELGLDTSIESVKSVNVSINIDHLVENKDFGNILLIGFIEERKREFLGLLQMIRNKKKSMERLIVPANSRPQMNVH